MSGRAFRPDGPNRTLGRPASPWTRRRDVLCLTAAQAASLLWSRTATSSEKLPRVAFVTPVGRFVDAKEGDAWKGLVTAFLQGLRELGYVDGSTMQFAFYSADGKLGQIDEVASRVLATSPDVILAGGGGANEVAHAFNRLTRTVPIVLANSSDPVMQGLVANLARPGGNITGVTGNTGPDFEVKRLELLRDVTPSASRVGYLGLKVDWESPAALAVRAAAGRLGATLVHAEHRSLDYEGAFEFFGREQLRAMFVARNPWNFSNRRAITVFAAERQIPAVYPTREFAEVGGLISYGPSLSDLYRRAARYVDKILKGERPRDLPVEQPTKFELVVNAKAAQLIGVTIPPSVLARADEVME